MNCEQVSANLSRYYDGEMSEAEAARCAEHICGCEACRCELESFQSITSAIAGGQAFALPAASWDRLSDRIQPKPGTSRTKILPPSMMRRFRLPLVTLGLTLAASLLLMFAPTAPTTSTSEISVDLSPVIDRYFEPAQALAHLNKQYAGEPVAGADVKSILGYEPVTPTGLPDDIEIVSTSVLRLPVCICTAGKCTCGPAGCNCSATLCKRRDGSELLVIEHCNSEKVELSKRAARLVKSHDRPLQLYGSADHLTASWVAKDRRLTAIGLRTEREALDMFEANSRN